MAHHKKSYTQYENQSVKQNFDNRQPFLISSNSKEHDMGGNDDSRNDNDFNNEIFYQYNLDDWQG